MQAEKVAFKFPPKSTDVLENATETKKMKKYSYRLVHVCAAHGTAML